MKRIIVTLLAVAMLLSACALAEGTFRVGMECDYPPFNWTQVDENEHSVPIDSGFGFAGGYDVEIAKRIAEGLGKELVIVKLPWDGLIGALTTDQIDAVIAGMSPTEERKVTVDFTDAYYNSDLVVVVRKDVSQLEGVNQAESTETFPDMITALSSGVIDGYISERPGAVSACAANADLTFVTPGFVASEEDTSVAVAIKKGQPELIEQINGILAGIDADARNQLMDDAVLNQPVSAE